MLHRRDYPKLSKTRRRCTRVQRRVAPSHAESQERKYAAFYVASHCQKGDRKGASLASLASPPTVESSRRRGGDGGCGGGGVRPRRGATVAACVHAVVYMRNVSTRVPQRF